MGQVGWLLFGFFWRGVAFIQAMWGCECFFRTNVWRQCGLENIPLSRLSDPQSDIHFRFIQLGLIFIYKSRASVYVRVKYWMYITRPRSTLLHLIISQQRMRLTTTYTINLYPDINHSLNTRHFSVKHEIISTMPSLIPSLLTSSPYTIYMWSNKQRRGCSAGALPPMSHDSPVLGANILIWSRNKCLLEKI